MKTLLQTVLFSLCICLTGYAQEFQQNYINYQGVANDASGNAITSTAIAIQIALKFGSATATASYIENHSVTTDANGVFSLQIGNGSVISGTYNPANWGTDASYITVSLNGTEVGTTEMMAVPYAISSGDTQWALNGIDIENKNTGTVKVLTNLEVTGNISTPTGVAINEFSIDGTLAGNSDTAVPTEKAVKTYIDNATSTTVTSINDLSDGKSDTNGSSLFLGMGAGTNDDGGNSNVGVGSRALFSNTSGVNNTANGSSALFLNTTGGNNTANGSLALYSNTTGISNTANGSEALYSNTSGNYNTANGRSALYSNTTGGSNTANGRSALFSNTTGGNNTANGRSALYSNTTGNSNTANGYRALYFNTTGGSNTANGRSALYSNTTGNNNTAIGRQALQNSNSSFNVAVGNDALNDVTTGSNNIGIGADSQVPNATASHQVRIGNTQITYAGVQVAWTVTSDKRWKDHVRNLPYGLNMIDKLRPVDYIRKNNDKKTRETGFIAQEVEKTLAAIGYDKQGFLTKDDKGYLSIRYNDLIPVLTKAIQEQQAQIEVLKTKNKSQDTVLVQVLKRLNTLEETAQRFQKEEISLRLNK